MGSPGHLCGERARDGDYALNDLGALRANPFHASRDFEGFTHRDLVSPTVLRQRTGRLCDFSSHTGFVCWKTEDLTDLDYTPLPLITRNNNEEDRQFTQEFRFASCERAASRPADIGAEVAGGRFFFTQNYEQDCGQHLFALRLRRSCRSRSTSTRPGSARRFRHGRLRAGHADLRSAPDAIVGVRGDSREQGSRHELVLLADVRLPNRRRYGTAISPTSLRSSLSRIALHSRENVYATAARGFKAGGFNSASPAGTRGIRRGAQLELRSRREDLMAGRTSVVNAAVSSSDWHDLQVNVPNPWVPAQFYIANAGSATSKGVEVELNARPRRGLDLFGGLGYTNARFGDGSVSGGVNVSGNKLSSTPDYTDNAGSNLAGGPIGGDGCSGGRRSSGMAAGTSTTRTRRSGRLFARQFSRRRAGVRVFVEGWLRNAFDTLSCRSRSRTRASRRRDSSASRGAADVRG